MYKKYHAKFKYFSLNPIANKICFLLKSQKKAARNRQILKIRVQGHLWKNYKIKVLSRVQKKSFVWSKMFLVSKKGQKSWLQCGRELVVAKHYFVGSLNLKMSVERSGSGAAQSDKIQNSISSIHFFISSSLFPL